MHLEQPPSDEHADQQRHSDGQRTGGQQARAAGPQALHEVRSGVEADDRHEAREPDGLENPQRRSRDAPEPARLHRPQPAADEPAEQHADGHAQPDLDAADVQRRQADERSCDDAGRDDEHVGDVRDAVCHADGFSHAGRAGRGPDERQHVAAMYDRVRAAAPGRCRPG